MPNRIRPETTTPRRYAQQGQRETCARCGYVVTLETVGHMYPSGEPMWRWVATRRTKRAGAPINCPAHPTQSYHQPTAYTIAGAPTDA